MSVVAKFKVTRVEKSIGTVYLPTESPQYQDREVTTVTLVPVSSSPDLEDQKFWAATPFGEIKIGTIRHEAAAQLELGKVYYVNFTEEGTDTQ